MAISSERIRYFRPRIEGPELDLEDAVVSNLTEVFERNDWPIWVGGSVPIGAGYPDIVSVWYDPQVASLADFQTSDGHILAYLRSVRRAKLDTIADRLRLCRRNLRLRIQQLEDSTAVNRHAEDIYSIAPAWREILPEIVTVEAKVADWKSALQQANRNRIFCHRSFAAFPENVAARVADTPGFSMHGVGILAVAKDGTVKVFRQARKNRPAVWNYYFHLAALAARDINDGAS